MKKIILIFFVTTQLVIAQEPPKDGAPEMYLKVIKAIPFSTLDYTLSKVCSTAYIFDWDDYPNETIVTCTISVCNAGYVDGGVTTNSQGIVGASQQKGWGFY
jgi:hypothetical protein